MTDVQALERYARTGDPDAFRHLVTCYQRLVYAACARRLRNDTDIEDAVQETFVKLAQHAGRIKTSVSGWLYTAATRVCLDRLRRDQTRKRHELAWRPEEGDNHAEHYGQLMLAVDDALEELPEAQRDLIVQYFLEGKTQTSLAQEAGVTQSAVARRVERAVKELRATLQQRGVTASAAALGAFFVADAANAQVPAVLTASLTKLGLSGAGVAATGATSGGGVLATLAQAGLPVKLAAGLGVAGVIGAGVVVMQPETPEASAPPSPSAAPAVMELAGGEGVEPQDALEALQAMSDDELRAVDHGMVLYAVDEPETLALMRRAQLAESQLMTVPMTMIMGLAQKLEQVQIEPTGDVIVRFEEAKVGDDGVARYPYTFAIPVAWEEEVAAPYAVQHLPTLHGVGFTYTGDLMGVADTFDRMFEQAAHDGHVVTGRAGMKTITFEGPMSEQNQFVFQVETLPAE